MMLRRIRINNQDIKGTYDLEQLKSKRRYPYFFIFTMFVGFSSDWRVVSITFRVHSSLQTTTLVLSHSKL